MALQNVTSKGTLGLPHYNNSRASSMMYEPEWKNLFWVQITLPAAVAMEDEERNLLLEEVTKVSGLDTNPVPDVTEQQYKFATRSYAQAGPAKTTIDISMDFNVNLSYESYNQAGAQETPGGSGVENYVIKLLRRWTDLIWDPLTGRMGLKKDYAAPEVVITMHDKVMNPYWQWTLYDCFPIQQGIGSIDLDYTNKNDIVKVSGFKLRCDHWDEVQL